VTPARRGSPEVDKAAPLSPRSARAQVLMFLDELIRGAAVLSTSQPPRLRLLRESPCERIVAPSHTQAVKIGRETDQAAAFDSGVFRP
jgi:hypothetical protein